MSPSNLFYAQSGGVTAVINASACGVIETARKHADRIGQVYAGRNGILGALREDLIDTRRESDADIAALRHTPGSAFGSCRYKLRDLESQRVEYERLVAVMQAHDIRYFLYNGGNDSSDTALKVSRISEALGYPLICIGIPKTVDNDLPETDCSPGFGSAAKYVATSIMEATLDIRSMCESSTQIFILEVMGRHAGWLAAAGGLAPQGFGPQVIVFPERPFDQTAFLRRVEHSVRRDGYCSIVVSEGAVWPDGRFLSESGSRDVFGHAQLGGVAPFIAELIRQQLGFKYHWAVADYLQRSARHVASATDVAHAYAVGAAAVELALAGKNAQMPIIRRCSDSPYHWEIGSAPLDQIANRERRMPLDFIDESGFGITDTARRYLEPLTCGEAFPPFKDGRPVYVRLANHPVPRKLPPAPESHSRSPLRP